MRVALLLGVALLTFSSPAMSADWRQFGTGGDGTPWFMDTTSVVKSGGVAQVWVRAEWAKPKGNITTSKELWRYRCPSRESVVPSWVDYDGSGQVVKEGTGDDYSAVVPETLGESALNIVCKA